MFPLIKKSAFSEERARVGGDCGSFPSFLLFRYTVGACKVESAVSRSAQGCLSDYSCAKLQLCSPGICAGLHPPARHRSPGAFCFASVLIIIINKTALPSALFLHVACLIIKSKTFIETQDGLFYPCRVQIEAADGCMFSRSALFPLICTQWSAHPFQGVVVVTVLTLWSFSIWYVSFSISLRLACHFSLSKLLEM